MLNKKRRFVKNAPKTYEDDLEDVKEATSNINNILNELNAIKNTEHD